MRAKQYVIYRIQWASVLTQWALVGAGIALSVLGKSTQAKWVIYLLLTRVGLNLLLTSEKKWAIWILYLLTIWVVFYSSYPFHRVARLKNLVYSKLLILLGIWLFCFLPARAQIHQAGQTTLEISGGLVDGFKLPGQDNFGTFGSLSYSKYRTLNSYWKGTVHLNQKFYAYDKAMIPVSQWLGEATYFTRVMGLINKSWVINVGGGIAGGYESINQDRGEIKGASIMNQSQWVLGPTLAIEGEYILTGRTILIARVQEYYLFRSNVIPTHFNVGVGIKFILDTDSDYK